MSANIDPLALKIRVIVMQLQLVSVRVLFKPQVDALTRTEEIGVTKTQMSRGLATTGLKGDIRCQGPYFTGHDFKIDAILTISHHSDFRITYIALIAQQPLGLVQLTLIDGITG